MAYDTKEKQPYLCLSLFLAYLFPLDIATEKESFDDT